MAKSLAVKSHCCPTEQQCAPPVPSPSSPSSQPPRSLRSLAPRVFLNLYRRDFRFSALIFVLFCFPVLANFSEEAEFDALEAEVDMDLEIPLPPSPSCIKPDVTHFSGKCIKPADLSRGKGFAPANEQGCVTASKGLGCEFVKEKNVFYPKCAEGYHVVSATPSLCSFNCPQNWADQPTQCVMPVPAASGGTIAVVRPAK